MSSIRLLENSMINKIAAGEVVERPLSVVKELAENSIDAGATAITVEIKDGGTSYIRVADNGKGIPADEVRTAFVRHATSKIATLEDLESVLTMGFRGEALSSIASVAQVVMVTKTAQSAAGLRMEINGGEVISETEVGAATGTDISVRNLFYNVPARQKFLKKPATEAGYISDIVNKLALGNENVAFKFINNTTTLLQTKGNGDLQTVIYQVYGKEVAGSLIGLNYNKAGVRLGGYIGKPSVSRGNRSYCLLYINGRYVKSDIVQNAVEEAYRTKLMQNKFPLYIMRLSLDPGMIDVNVHPTKLEVRFGDEDLIYKSVYAAVDAALRSEALIPEARLKAAELVYADVTAPGGLSAAVVMGEERETPAVSLRQAPAVVGGPTEGGPVRQAPVLTRESAADGMDNAAAPWGGPVRQAPVFARESAKPHSAPDPAAVQGELPPADDKAFFNAYRLVGQVFNTYWLVEQGSSVYLIDQHAAHERALYEKLNTGLKSKSVDSQRLLQPIIIPVSQTEKQLITDNAGFLKDCGFDIQEFDPTSYVLYAVPFILGNPTSAGFFIEILDRLGTLGDVYDAKLDAVASMSCKAAVKANDRLSHAEAQALIEQVLKLENPFTCPHGRPTVVELTKTELEKMFKRIQP